MSSGTHTPHDDDTRDATDDRFTTSPRAAEPASPTTRLINPPSNRKGARTLTATQLEKKRANDREAQRAIRERTKNQIETLEKRIKDLESGQAYQQLQDALKQKQVVEAENQDLRNRLAGVMDILRPLFPPDQFPNIPPTALSSSAPPDPAFSASVECEPLLNATREPYIQQLSSQEGTPTVRSASWNDSGTSIVSPGPQWESSKSHSHQRQPTNGGASEERTPMSSGASPNGVVAPLLKRQRSTYESANSSPATSADLAASEQYPPSHWGLLPANINPTCRYDSIIYDFLTVSRRRHAAGESLRDILGGSQPVLNGLVDPASELASASYFSTLLIDVLKGFSAIKGWPEKICIVSNMFPLMKWLISPTKENFDGLPPFMYPVESQLKVPHPIWVDHLPWPAMRHKMVYQYPWLPLDNFFMPYTSKFSVNYPHQDIQSCLYQNPKTGEMHPHPDLYEHGRILENWSVGPEFAKSHPILAETCRIKDG